MDFLSTLFKQRSRKIGVLVPAVVVSEKHADSLEITEHPVESGAAISDHAYLRPSEVVMECGFAGGGSLVDFMDSRAWFDGVLTIGRSPAEAYKALLELQESRQPFDVITGKRKYTNMLLRAIEVTTDQQSEYVLNCTITLRQLLITETSTATIGQREGMARPEDHAPVVDSGVKTPRPAEPIHESSLLKELFQ